jgi:hypothetical protein
MGRGARPAAGKRGAARFRVLVGTLAGALLGAGPGPSVAATAAADSSDARPFSLGFLARVEPAAAFDAPSFQKLDLTLQPTVVAAFGDWRLTGVARLRVDPAGELSVRTEGEAQRAPLSRPWWLGDHAELELRELYVDGRLGPATLRLGKQQVVWGQADGLRVLDVVNPMSYREFVLPAPEDRRIPLWTVNVEVPVGEGSLQALWIADPTYDEVPLGDQPFAFTSPLLIPQVPPGVPVTVEPVQRPQGLRDGSDYGLRWQRPIGRVDLSANWLYHHYDVPVPFRHVDPAGVVVAPRYERTQLLGSAFSTVLGSTALRGEVGWSSRRWFLTDDRSDADGVYASGELAYVLGVDYTGLRDTLLSTQLFQSRLERAVAGSVRNRVESNLTLLLQRDFANDVVRLRLMALRSLDRGDGSVQMQFAWQLRSQVRATLGVDVFYGDRDGLYGQFDRASRALLGFEWGSSR